VLLPAQLLMCACQVRHPAVKHMKRTLKLEKRFVRACVGAPRAMVSLHHRAELTISPFSIFRLYSETHRNEVRTAAGIFCFPDEPRRCHDVQGQGWGQG
jgi:hypothetical protein